MSADRGRLYLNMLDVVKKVKPIAFVAENVDGIRKNKENKFRFKGTDSHGKRYK